MVVEPRTEAGRRSSGAECGSGDDCDSGAVARRGRQRTVDWQSAPVGPYGGASVWSSGAKLGGRAENLEEW